MENKLIVAGVGPGNFDLITPRAKKAIENGQVLIGGTRNLELFQNPGQETFAIHGSLDEMAEFIRENSDKRIVVLASGDPLLFGISSFLKKVFPEMEIEIISGISALQYLCSVIGMPWDNIKIASIHGRDENLEYLMENYEKIGLYTGKKPEKILQKLNRIGYGDVKVVIGENLSLPNEKISYGIVSEFCHTSFSDLTTLLFQRQTETQKRWPYVTGGIKDELFQRGSVPMTKAEVRALAISKLMLRNDSIVLDIGAGTGSVSIECALHVPKGKVIAYECNDEALDLIRLNAASFGVYNIEIVEGPAEESLQSQFQPCNRAFIGGSGGKLKDILKKLAENENIRVVITAITPETVMEALVHLQETGFINTELVMSNLSVGQKAGSRHMMKALNPITIISAERGRV